MGTFVIVAILAIIVVYTVFSYRKKLKSGCCGGEADVSAIKPKDSDKSHFPYKKKIFIQGMSCSNCKNRIENTFHKQEGFLMEVSLNDNVGILYLKQDTSNQAITHLIEDLGYNVTKIEDLA